MFEREFGAMNGCRGGSAASTGRCTAGEPTKAFSEPACGPSGIGAGGAAAAGAAPASSKRAMTKPVRTARDCTQAFAGRLPIGSGLYRLHCMSTGAIIRTARQAEGLTQAQLARRLGITQPSVARLEAAGDNVTIATLQRALNVMNRTLEITARQMPSSVDETQ